MKRILLVIFILLFALAPCFSSAEAAENWYEPPVITKAYEQSTNKLYLEWTGHAPLYQIFVDGKKDTDIILNHYVVDISKGTHSIGRAAFWSGRNMATRPSFCRNAF